jgi:hypothetical protein
VSHESSCRQKGTDFHLVCLDVRHLPTAQISDFWADALSFVTFLAWEGSTFQTWAYSDALRYKGSSHRDGSGHLSHVATLLSCFTLVPAVFKTGVPGGLPVAIAKGFSPYEHSCWLAHPLAVPGELAHSPSHLHPVNTPSPPAFYGVLPGVDFGPVKLP